MCNAPDPLLVYPSACHNAILPLCYSKGKLRSTQIKFETSKRIPGTFVHFIYVKALTSLFTVLTISTIHKYGFVLLPKFVMCVEKSQRKQPYCASTASMLIYDKT